MSNMSKYLIELEYYNQIFGYNYSSELMNNYTKDANKLFTNFDDFNDQNEWHYISSNLEQNVNLLKQLDAKGLLKNINNICDCGIGLGTAMFNLYLQSKEICDKTFTFSGVEKYVPYINHFKNNLKQYWSNINYIEAELMDQNYSNFNIIYSFSPFKTEKQLTNFYYKILEEVLPGSLLIENRENGKGFNSILLTIKGFEMIQLNDIVIFKKK